MPERAYVKTMFDSRGNHRGYEVRGPTGFLMKRYERRTYMSLKLCLQLAEGLTEGLPVFEAFVHHASEFYVNTKPMTVREFKTLKLREVLA